MKKILSILIIFFICLSVSASDIKNLPYKDIKENGKIKITEFDSWSDKVKRKDANSFVRQGNLLKATDNSYIIDTKCSYLFIDKNRLFGYSPSIMRFYEFTLNQGRVKVRELDFYEVSSLFEDFHIISISEFSKSTNVFKIKKKRSEEKIMIINDTGMRFDNYKFSTNNAKFETYNINNTIGVTKSGMIQFSKSGETVKNAPWFILLVR